MAQASGGTVASDPLPDAAPEATDKTREQKRFDRYDKDRDAKITREEYLVQRRKAYARLDVDGDGKLSFDEWAVKAATKFADADRDKSGAMTAPEFATTAVKRKGPSRVNCPAGSACCGGELSHSASAAGPRSVYIRLRSAFLVRPVIGGNSPKFTFIG